MRKIVYDIETRNMFQDVGNYSPEALDLSIIGIYDSERDVFESFTQEELPKLWPILEKADLLIGFNSDHFDMPILNKYYPGDLSKIKSVDLLVEIHKSLGRRISLNSVAKGTLGAEKSGHGLDAISWWKKGEIDKIRKYCLDDVRLTRDVYEYARANKKLKYMEGPETREIRLIVGDWEKIKDPAAMTHTLPF